MRFGHHDIRPQRFTHTRLQPRLQRSSAEIHILQATTERCGSLATRLRVGLLCSMIQPSPLLGWPWWSTDEPMMPMQVEIKEVRCYEAKIEESVKGRQPPGIEPRTPLAWAASALPLTHDSRTTTNPHNPLYVLHKWSSLVNIVRWSAWGAPTANFGLFTSLSISYLPKKCSLIGHRVQYKHRRNREMVGNMKATKPFSPPKYAL